MVNIFKLIKEKKAAFRKEQIKQAREKLNMAKDRALEKKAIAKEQAELAKIKAKTRKLKGPSVLSRVQQSVSEARKAGHFTGKPGGVFANGGGGVFGQTTSQPKSKPKKRKQARKREIVVRY